MSECNTIRVTPLLFVIRFVGLLFCHGGYALGIASEKFALIVGKHVDRLFQRLNDLLFLLAHWCHLHAACHHQRR